MKNENEELIRSIMAKSNKYTHDICNLSISEIISLINYNKNLIAEFGITENYNSYCFKIIFELEEYLDEYNERLGTRVKSYIIG